MTKKSSSKHRGTPRRGTILRGLARLSRPFIAFAGVASGIMASFALADVNRAISINDAVLASHPPQDATTTIPNPLPEGTITALVSSHAGSAGYSPTAGVLIEPIWIFHPRMSFILALIAVLALASWVTKRTRWNTIPLVRKLDAEAPKPRWWWEFTGYAEVLLLVSLTATVIYTLGR